jgi:hypothetical protein
VVAVEERRRRCHASRLALAFRCHVNEGLKGVLGVSARQLTDRFALLSCAFIGRALWTTCPYSLTAVFVFCHLEKILIKFKICPWLLD